MSKTIILLTAALLCSPFIQAQNTTNQPTDTLKLDKIIVTASKMPTSLRETTRSALVIDEKTIREYAGQDLSQLLNEYTGIMVNGAFSNPAKDKALYIQGAPLKYTLILVDGLPVNDPSGTGGLIDLRSLSLSSVERIEIVKGGMSTLYGTDAIAGVINVITRSSSQEKVSVDGMLSYGSYQSYTGSLGINGSSGPVRYSLNYNREGSDGLSDALRPDGSTADFDKDGFTRDALRARTTIELTDGFEVSPFVNYSTFEGGYDGGSFTDADNTYQIDLLNPGLQAKYQLSSFSVEGAYSYTQTDRSFEDSFGIFEGKGRLHNADVFISDDLAGYGRFVLGFNYQDFSLEDDDDAVENPSADIVSPYVNFIVNRFGSLNLEAGMRVNQHSEFGANLTHALSASIPLNDQLLLRSSYSTGFRAPTLNELFGPFGANPDLQPETSRSLDVGLKSYLLDERLVLKALYFDRVIEDLVFYDFNLGYQNLGKDKARGVELSADWILGEAIDINGYLNVQKLEEDAYRRPEYAGGLILAVNPLDQLRLTGSGNYTGERKDIFFNTTDFSSSEVVLDPYFLLNLKAEYTLSGIGSRIFVDIKNLLDNDYTEVYGFSTQGINVKAGLRFQF